MRNHFDRLEVWFEKTVSTHIPESTLSNRLDIQLIPNQYKPATSWGRLLTLPEIVTFTSPDPECFPVPSPELLGLHAVCCKVAHMSGAAEYLDKYDYDMDHLDVLNPDGTSSGVLHHAIWEKLGRLVDVEE